jgi:hypothetical protein
MNVVATSHVMKGNSDNQRQAGGLMADRGWHPIDVQDVTELSPEPSPNPGPDSSLTDSPHANSPHTIGAVAARAVHTIVDLPPLRPALLNAARLIVETMLIPTALLAILLHVSGLVVAFMAALGWCYFTVAVRWLAGRRLPGTLMLCAGMLTSRACVAMWLSSAVVYLMQPVLGSIFMAVLFLGSAAIGRPVTMRLARDFVALPAHVLDRRRVQKMFRDVAMLWGLSRVLDAAMSLGFLREGVDAGLLARGVLSPVLTTVTVAVCAYWGVRCLRSDGIRLRRRGRLAPAN